MSLSKKRKEGIEIPLNKRKKTLHYDANTRKLTSDLNPEIKVENEFDNLFEEEEADLTIKEALQDIKLDIFDEDLDGFGDELACQTERLGNCDHKSDTPSISVEKTSNMKKSPKVIKIIDKQKEALKLIQIALMKFESVTKDLQELVEFDIEEAEADLEDGLDSSSTVQIEVNDISPQYMDNCLKDSEAQTKETKSQQKHLSISVSHSSETVCENEKQTSSPASLPNSQKNQKLIKKCSSTKNTCSKLPCVVLKNIMDEKSSSKFTKSCNEHDGIISDTDDNDASDNAPEDRSEAVISSLGENHLATLSSRIEDSQPSTSHESYDDEISGGCNFNPISEQNNETAKETSFEEEIPQTSFKIDEPCAAGVTKIRIQTNHRNNFRPCPFCGIQQTKLSRHIASQHKSEPDVANALKLPTKERIRFFSLLRKKGIEKANRESLKSTGKLKFLQRRGKDGPFVKCSGCLGFYRKCSFQRHASYCKAILSQISSIHSIPVSGRICEDSEFNIKIKSRFRNDEIGEFINDDEMILEYGKYKFQKAKNNKEKENVVRKGIMITMRSIGTICIHFQKILETHHTKNIKSSLDLFKKGHFDWVMKALEKMANSHLPNKLQIGFKLKAYAKFIKLFLKEKGNDKELENVSEFLSILQEKWEFHFGLAQRYVDNRALDLTKPEESPTEEDVHKVRVLLISTLKKLDSMEASEWTYKEYILARRAVVCRLAFFNGCRGNEAARLTLKNWEDAANNKWINKSLLKQIEENECNLFDQYKVAYVSGKGRNRVPIIIPKECVLSVERLQDKNIRKKVKISKSNIFVFPHTQNSDYHADGWTDINFICSEAGVMSNINFTKVRHRSSTTFASLEMPKRHKEALFRNLKHSDQVYEQ